MKTSFYASVIQKLFKQKQYLAHALENNNRSSDTLTSITSTVAVVLLPVKYVITEGIFF